MSPPEQLTDLLTDLRPTSDFPALIWIMTSSATTLLSAASELEWFCLDSAAVLSLSEDTSTVSSDVLSFVEGLSAAAITRVLKLSETV